jgi:ferredoxin
MTLTIHIDRDLCIGAQNCVRWAPSVFTIDDEGLACVIADDPEPWAAQVVEAARDCPTNAILVTRDGASIS